MVVKILKGIDFDPVVAGFQGIESTNKDFLVYSFKKIGIGINV